MHPTARIPFAVRQACRAAAVIAGLALAAAPASADAEPRIVTDIAPVQSLVAMVVGDLAEVDVLVRPGASPHGYALRPSAARALAEAEVVIWIGAAQTPWLAEALAVLNPGAHSLPLLEVAGTHLRPDPGDHAGDHGAGHDDDHAAGPAGDHDAGDGGDDEHGTHAPAPGGEVQRGNHSDAHGDDHSEGRNEHDGNRPSGIGASGGTSDGVGPVDAEARGPATDPTRPATRHSVTTRARDGGGAPTAALTVAPTATPAPARPRDPASARSVATPATPSTPRSPARPADPPAPRSANPAASPPEPANVGEPQDVHGTGTPPVVHDAGRHDVHGSGDGRPDVHAWLDPANAVHWLGAIATALGEADPANAASYAANATAAAKRLRTLEADLAHRLAGLTGQYVTFHDAYGYFEARFGLQSLGSVAASTAVDPGPASLARLRDRVAASNAVCLFTEPQFNPRRVTALAADLNLQIGTLDPLGTDLAPGPDLYPQLLEAIADSFVACLKA